jgi:hypothetical protein
MQTADLDTLLKSIICGLPAPVRTTLNEFWSAAPATNPATGEKVPAPFLVFGEGWTKQAGALGVSSLANYGDGRCLMFDADFVLEAPPEAVATLVAHELAHVHENATGRSSGQSIPKREKAVGRRIAKWGYDEREIEMWLGAKEADLKDPVSTFYAYRFEKLRRHPPANADFNAIAQILVGRGLPALARQVLEMANSCPGVGTGETNSELAS